MWCVKISKIEFNEKDIKKESAQATIKSFAELRTVLEAKFPNVVSEIQPPISYKSDFLSQPGAEQLHALWSVTSGQANSTLGLIGGLRLIGPAESDAEREKWQDLMTGTGLDAIAHPSWDDSISMDPDAVRGIYFANGWIPVLCEPLEANYLAVDLVPLPGGHPGQIVLCGRDEDEKCVVAPNLAYLFRALAEECREGCWELCTQNSKQGPYMYVTRRGGRLLTACKQRLFPHALY